LAEIQNEMINDLTAPLNALHDVLDLDTLAPSAGGGGGGRVYEVEEDEEPDHVAIQSIPSKSHFLYRRMSQYVVDMWGLQNSNIGEPLC
jgi:hypothetical protein